jgi:predicted transcriptional regulator
VAEPAEERKEEGPASLAARTTEIAVAYVMGNTVAVADLGHLIETLGRALNALSREEAKPATAKPAPAVPVRRSIQQDHLVCLVCGKRQKTLRRHLNAAHQLSPEAYRELFGLGSDYPMTASSYARQRSEAARRSGLGRAQAPPRPRQPRRTG